MRSSKLPFTLVVVIALFGCERRPESVRIDFDRAGAELVPHLTRVFDDPAIDRAIDAYLDALGDSPALGAVGARLLTVLQVDPKMTAEIDKLVAELTASPRLAELTTALAKANPGRDPDELFGEKIEKTWAQPENTKAAEAAGQELMRRIQAADELGNIGHTIEPRLESMLNDSTRLAAWGKRLTELNGGSVPDRARATELYMKTAWSDAHVRIFATEVLANPAMRIETAAVVAELLGLAPIAGEVQRDAIELISDVELRGAMVTLVFDLLEVQPNLEQIQQRMRELMLAPRVVQMCKHMAHTLVTEPAVAQIVNTHLARLADDPALRATFYDFFDHW